MTGHLGGTSFQWLLNVKMFAALPLILLYASAKPLLQMTLIFLVIFENSTGAVFLGLKPKCPV